MNTKTLIYANLIIIPLVFVGCGIITTPATTTTVTPRPAATRTPTTNPTPTEVVIKGTVSIWHSWEEPQRPALLRSIAAFQDVYPDVQFDVLYVPQVDLHASFTAATSEGGGPTILFGPAEWGPDLYDKGLIVDISGFAGERLIESLNQAAVGAARYRDALIGLPQNIEGVVLFRNKSIIPEAPATYDELETLAKSATDLETVGAILERSFFFSAAHLYGLGGRLMTPDGDPAFDENGYRMSLAWMDLLQSFEDAGPTEYYSDNDLSLFKEGKVGFIIDGTWNMRSLAEAVGAENLAIDHWPLHKDGKLSGFVQAENVYISPRAIDRVYDEDQMVAWMFVESFLSPVSQSAMADVGYIPAVMGPSEVSIRDSLIAQAMVALEGGSTYPVVPEMALYTSTMEIALQSIFNQQVPADEALQKAYDTILEAIAAMRLNPTPSP